MTGSEKDTTRGFSLANDVRGSRCAQNTSLTDQKLLDTVGGSNLCDQLNDLWVPVSSIASNDQEAVLHALGNGEQDAGDERFAVVGFLEYNDLLPQTRTVKTG